MAHTDRNGVGPPPRLPGAMRRSLASQFISLGDDVDDLLGGGVDYEHLVLQHRILVRLHCRHLAAHTVGQWLQFHGVWHSPPTFSVNPAGGVSLAACLLTLCQISCRRAE